MSCGVELLALEPVALEEIVHRAALQSRVDRKYVIPAPDAELVAAMLPPETRVLEVDGRRSFDYASMYFDTPARDSYLRAAYRRRRRFKVRTRAYGSSGRPFVEVKTRRGRLTVKERLGCEDAETLSRTERAFVESRLAAAGIDDIAVSSLAPVLETRFRRSTLLAADGGTRVTFDSFLRFSTAVGGDGGRLLELPAIAIVETKTAGRPSSVDRMLWSLGIRPVAVSKYGTGLAAMQTDLPRTRWARVIRTRFSPAGEGDARRADARLGSAS